MAHPTELSEDERLARQRAQVMMWSTAAKRVGYAAVLVAIVVFGIGAATSFAPAIVAIIVGSIVLSGLTLIPAIVLGYGVKMAESEERGEPFRH